MINATLKLPDELARGARAAGLLNKGAMQMSEPGLCGVWDNP
jgi:hypothetical protein